jgi:signal transduction histidine kinase/CheY-like chemotaxis protein
LKSGNLTKAADSLDRAFAGVDVSRTTPGFTDFHQTATEVYSKVGRYELALEHFRAFKRLDDQARELMVNTNSALVAAEFDFANQDLRIARLKAEQLKKDAEIARTRNGITLVLLGGSVITAGLLGFNFLSLRRSSRRIEAANTRLNAANDSLEQALKAKSEFLATTSHEIRTPLNGILGVTQVLLADPNITPEVRDRVTLMHGAGETMRALVSDILDAAKIENGSLTIEKGETDLAGLLDDAGRFWTDKAEEKGLSLTVERGETPARIVEDGPRLRQVVFNLLSNAIKFTDEGSVQLSAGVEGGETAERLVLRVSDTGIGIPADQVDSVFESFRQVDGSVTRRFGGTGLGLSISRDLAEAMGGTLGVESELGKGSTFILTLPLVRPAAGADGVGEGPCPAGEVFLIVEANPLTQSVLKSVVAPLGLAAETAASLDAAVERLGAGGVAALLVDANGLGAHMDDRLKALSRLTSAGARRIVVTWPSPDEETLHNLRGAGAAQVIAKPISAARLTAALREGLDAEA